LKVTVSAIAKKKNRAMGFAVGGSEGGDVCVDDGHELKILIS
jgi:hypothetical protein